MKPSDFYAGQCVDIRVQQLWPTDRPDLETWVFGWVREIDNERLTLECEGLEYDVVIEDITEVLPFPESDRV